MIRQRHKIYSTGIKNIDQKLNMSHKGSANFDSFMIFIIPATAQVHEMAIAKEANALSQYFGMSFPFCHRHQARKISHSSFSLKFLYASLGIDQFSII
ncbi:hypothetical protein HMPREF1986_02814, partial [Oribacterium sp. oral taxon 078 str. F0263]